MLTQDQIQTLYVLALGWLAYKPEAEREGYIAMLADTFTKTKNEVREDFRDATSREN